MTNNKKEQSGEAFTKQQKATDKAINERNKKEQGVEKLDPSKETSSKRDRQVDTPQKKTGGGKQKGPGM